MNQATQHYRTQLNNWLQVNGGSGRLGWCTSHDGPENNPTWTAVCLIDSVEWDRANGRTLVEAKEEAARRVLRTLSFRYAANTGRLVSS